MCYPILPSASPRNQAGNPDHRLPMPLGQFSDTPKLPIAYQELRREHWTAEPLSRTVSTRFTVRKLSEYSRRTGPTRTISNWRVVNVILVLFGERRLVPEHRKHSGTKGRAFESPQAHHYIMVRSSANHWPY